MNISYDVSLDHLIAFNLYHAGHSPTMRRQILIGRSVVAIIVGIGFLALLSFSPLEDGTLDIAAYIAAIVCGMVMFFLYPWLMRRSIKGLAKKMAREGKNIGMLGPQRLELRATGIINESDSGSSTHTWASVERIGENEQYAFIYVSALSAFIIPNYRVLGSVKIRRIYLRRSRI